MITMVPREDAASMVGLITADNSNDPQFQMGFRVAIEAAVGCIRSMPVPEYLDAVWRVKFDRQGTGKQAEMFVLAPSLMDAFTKVVGFVRESWGEHGEEPIARQLLRLDEIELVARDVQVIR